MGSVTGELRMGQATVVIVKFIERSIGRYQEQIEFEFKDVRTKKCFVMSQTALAVIGDPILHEELKAKAPYLARGQVQREPETNVVDGIKPPALRAISYVTPMPRVEIPPRLLVTLNGSSSPSSRNVQTIQRTFFPPDFNPEKHGKQFKVLMWIEEHRMEYVVRGISLFTSSFYSTLGKTLNVTI